MSKKMAAILIGYGLLLLGAAFVLHSVAPGLSEIMFGAGVAAGALSVVWGIVAMAGHKRRVWAMLTLVPLALVTMTQMVHAWMVPASANPGKIPAALLLTLLMAATVGMLMYLLHGERSPEFYLTGSLRRPEAQSRRRIAHAEHGGGG